MSNDQSNTIILETRGLTKEFKGFAAVQDVNLQVRRGSIHALIGPNGAGKTTVFNLLTKFLQPTRGTILFNGNDITREEPAQIARRGVIRSFQISATFGHMTALENVRLGLQRKLGSSFQFWRHERSLDQLNARAMALLEEVDLASYALTIKALPSEPHSAACQAAGPGRVCPQDRSPCRGRPIECHHAGGRPGADSGGGWRDGDAALQPGPHRGRDRAATSAGCSTCV